MSVAGLFSSLPEYINDFTNTCPSFKIYPKIWKYDEQNIRSTFDLYNETNELNCKLDEEAIQVLNSSIADESNKFNYVVEIDPHVYKISVFKMFSYSLGEVLNMSTVSALTGFTAFTFMPEFAVDFNAIVQDCMVELGRMSSFSESASVLLNDITALHHGYSGFGQVPLTTFAVTAICTSIWIYLAILGISLVKVSSWIPRLLMPNFPGVSIVRAPYTFVGIVLTCYVLIGQVVAIVLALIGASNASG